MAGDLSSRPLVARVGFNWYGPESYCDSSEAVAKLVLQGLSRGTASLWTRVGVLTLNTLGQQLTGVQHSLLSFLLQPRFL